jgi:hypothetical protein
MWSRRFTMHHLQNRASRYFSHPSFLATNGNCLA